jgi:hypothetical protein
MRPRRYGQYGRKNSQSFNFISGSRATNCFCCSISSSAVGRVYISLFHPCCPLRECKKSHGMSLVEVQRHVRRLLAVQQSSHQPMVAWLGLGLTAFSAEYQRVPSEGLWTWPRIPGPLPVCWQSCSRHEQRGVPDYPPTNWPPPLPPRLWDRDGCSASGSGRLPGSCLLS